ncbi:MAG: hypothetical protein KAS32_07000 [Candidatus Peribacteraceae bacterium]|nr:hypothetical protein [Candidatus Peribacteraceae bacterium]
MAAVNKINSNDVSIAYAEEESIKTLPGTPVWYGLQPNTISDFGGNITKVGRDFITDDRQMRKGETTDLEAAGSMNHDLVQTGLQRLMQGFMYADFRYKPETGGMGDVGVITSIGASDDYTRTSGSFTTDGYEVGDMIFASGFTNAANNGLKTILTVAALTLTVNETLVAEAAPPAEAQLVVCGFEFATGDLDVDVTGDLPKLTATAKDCTELGIIPGETIYVGGDLTANKFAGAANNGLARVRSVAAGYIELDKSETTMVIEDNTTLDIRVFTGRVLKNETGSNIVRRTYNIERTLGAPDDAAPAEIQSEYVTGAVPSEVTINVPRADKATVDMAFLALDSEQRDGSTGVKTGTRVDAVEEEFFNTSSNVPRIKIAAVSSTDEAPTALYAFAEELTLTINNNVSADKAIGVLGGFDATHGNFMVSGSMTVFFADVAGVAAVRNNTDITMEIHMIKNNTGMSIDVPLMSLGDGRVNVEKNQSVKLPLTQEAATGANIDSTLNHTLMIVFFDYLPDAAE